MTAPTIPELVAWLRHEANQWEESERYAATADALERAYGDGDETARCRCQWVSPEDGVIRTVWPAELDLECPVHGAEKFRTHDVRELTPDALERLMELEAVTEVQDTLGGGMLQQIAEMWDALERLEREVERLREALTPLHDELAALLCDEDLTDEKLRRAADTLLPRLHDALIPLVRAARTQEDTDGDA